MMTLATVHTNLKTFDRAVTRWLARRSVALLRISLGLIFFWFGVLKFFPGASPAEQLASRTIEVLTFGTIHENLSLPILALWEVFIGVCFIANRWMRAAILLLLAQMLGTVAPLFLFPEETWTRFLVAGTLEGQYIIKNLVLVAGALVVGATVRGGALVAEREPLRA
jgi:uncharacterized membrane protein YkgB